MERLRFLEQLRGAFRVNPVVGLLGPRQCGKTTLARMFAAQRNGPVAFFDLESPGDQARLTNPQLALERLKGLVVIDEVQRAPGLFEVIRVLVDRRPLPTQFLILGSASRDLLHQSSETLAGRISYLELTPFNASEVGVKNSHRLWMRGGFPKSFLASNQKISSEWREHYISTYLERDLPSLGIQIASQTMRRFWMMLAHYHGQLFNASEIGRSMGLAHTTVQHYLDILVGTLMVRRLPGWTENIAKRQVKTPKIYFRDSGIFHSLLGIQNEMELDRHPRLGASWEGWALEEILRILEVREEEAYFWATHNKAELDLLVLKNGQRLGFEVKFTDKPKVTRSMHTAMKDLGLKTIYVVYPGEHDFPLAPGIKALASKTLAQKNP